MSIISYKQLRLKKYYNLFTLAFSIIAFIFAIFIPIIGLLFFLFSLWFRKMALMPFWELERELEFHGGKIYGDKDEFGPELFRKLEVELEARNQYYRSFLFAGKKKKNIKKLSQEEWENFYCGIVEHILKFQDDKTYVGMKEFLVSKKPDSPIAMKIKLDEMTKEEQERFLRQQLLMAQKEQRDQMMQQQMIFEQQRQMMEQQMQQQQMMQQQVEQQQIYNQMNHF